MFKKYDSIEDYNADTLAPDEKRVSLIMDRDYVVDVKYDAPMREVTLPAVGDALFIENNGGAKHFYRDANYTPNGMTLVGVVFNVNGNKVKILHKAFYWRVAYSVWQYEITNIASTDIQIGLRMSNNYGAYANVDVTLTSTAINKTTADEISAAVAAKATAVGDTNPWWAYLADANGNKVDSNGTKIIVQTDNCSNWQQYLVTGTNVDIRLCMFNEVSGSNLVLRNTMSSSDSGVMEVSRAVNYYTNSGATPSSNVGIDSTTIVKKTSFDSSAYCATLRSEYVTYKNYIAANMVKYPQVYGVFTCSDAEEITSIYGSIMAPTKNGLPKAKYPAINSASSYTFNSEGLTTGNWHLADITDGIEILDSNILPKIRKFQTSMNLTTLNNTNDLFFARKANSYCLWSYSQSQGLLSIPLYNVSGTKIVLGVATISINFNNL